MGTILLLLGLLLLLLLAACTETCCTSRLAYSLLGMASASLCSSADISTCSD
jgi:hypothetical protein